MEKMHGVYEQKQLGEIDEWEKCPPNVVSKTLGFFASPLVWAAKQIIPEDAMEQALQGAFGAAGAFSGSDDLIKESQHLGFDAQSVKDFQRSPLHVNDTLADGVVTWAKGLAAAEGAATGVTGFAGLAVDIPAVIVLAIRTIRKIGFCYGFDTALESERTFVLQVLSAGAANSMEEKRQAIVAAGTFRSHRDNENEKAIAAQSERHILSKEGFTAAVRNLAKQLAINLTKRKAAQTIPVIGGGVAAVMNALFISDVAEAARRLYQKRRLEVITVADDLTTV